MICGWQGFASQSSWHRHGYTAKPAVGGSLPGTRAAWPRCQPCPREKLVSLVEWWLLCPAFRPPLRRAWSAVFNLSHQMVGCACLLHHIHFQGSCIRHHQHQPVARPKDTRDGGRNLKNNNLVAVICSLIMPFSLSSIPDRSHTLCTAGRVGPVPNENFLVWKESSVVYFESFLGFQNSTNHV